MKRRRHYSEVQKFKIGQVSCLDDKFSRSSEKREVSVAVFTFMTGITATID